MSDSRTNTKTASQEAFFSILVARFKDGARWRKSIYDLVLWFLVALLLTTAGRLYSPGYPIVVGTDSIRTGIYWLDRTDFEFDRNSFVTFDFAPAEQWLTARYGKRVHTKMVAGLAGDVVKADSKGSLTICTQAAASTGGIPSQDSRCHSVGIPRDMDSQGRPMTPWLQPGQQYVLQPNELWVYGQHPKSLDSRYQGPVGLSSVHGKASPMFLF